MKNFLALIMFSSFFNVATAQSKDEAAVAQAVESLRKAMLDGDKAGLEKITAPSLTYGHSGGNIEDRASFISNISSGKSDFVTLELTAQTISVTGHTAIVRHTLSAQTNDGGKPNTVNLYVMLAWGKEGGQWKLVGRQSVKIPVTEKK